MPVIAIGGPWLGSTTAVAAADAPKVYVDTLRIVDEKGPERPQLTEPLIAFLRRRGYRVVTQRPGDPLDHDAYRLTKVILVKSTLRPPSLGSHGSSEMEVQGVLIPPTKEEYKLGPFSTLVALEPGEFFNRDLTRAGVNRVLTEAFLPLVNAMGKLMR